MKLKSCQECPYSDWGSCCGYEPSCLHPDEHTGILISETEVPQWCPLRDNPVILEIE